jgi:flagellar hook-associated protein 2
MGISPLTFSGISSYSADFQTILTRAVQVARLPVQQLQNQQTDLLQQKTLAGSLNTSMERLATALKDLRSVGDEVGIVGSSSNSSKVSVLSTTGDTPTAYRLTDIESLASAASETSLTAYASSTDTSVSTNSNVRLSVGGTNYDITLSAGNNNLIGLRNAINAKNAGVTATILTAGPGQNYLSVTANGSGNKPITLVDDPTGVNTTLLSATNPGTNARFKLNGVQIERSSNIINSVVPGLSFEVKGTTSGTEAVTLTLASDRNRLPSALRELAAAFNQVREDVNGQTGETAGLLSGDFLVREAQTVLRRLSTFEGSGDVSSLAGLGLNFDQQGKLTFDSDKFNSLSANEITSAFAFVDSDNLGRYVRDVEQFTDPVNGLVKLQIEQYDRADKRLTDNIATIEERIALMRSGMQLRLQIADSLLGGLESQKTVLDASIQSVTFTNFGKKE